MKPGFKVTTKQWDDLSESEKGVLKKLGVQIFEEKEGKREAKYKIGIKLDSYYLGVNITCRLCGYRYNGYYRMEAKESYTSPFLQGKRLNPMKKGILPDRWEEQTVVACQCCKKRLLDLSKESLIDKLLFLSRCYAALGSRR
jgi:hypothetical protein